jgi:glycosyltransferase involved in cell wall biosynthesis
MKILFCNKYNFPFSGTEVYLFQLMDLLRSHGHEVALFSMADPRGGPTEYDRYFVPHIDFKQSRLGLLERAKLGSHAIYSRDARRRLWEMIAAFRPDVAHVRNIYHHLSPSIFWELKSQRIPVIYHLNDFKLLCPAYNFVAHGQACELCKGGKFSNVVRQGCYAGGRGAAMMLAAEAYAHDWIGTYRKCVDCFLTPSQFARRKLMESGFEANRIRVLPHFQHVSRQATPPIRAGAPVIYFGRLSPEKGVADLVMAVRTLPNIRLQIAGDGPQREELQALARQAGENVEFLGHVSEERLESLIAASCFSVFPSHAYETMGKSILESYAQARAVIATDLGSRRELVVHGENGLLYESGDVEQLAGAISYLHARPDVATEMGAAGRRLVELKHTPEMHYEVLSRLYEETQAKAAKTSTAARQAGVRVAFIGARGVVSKYSGIETYYEEVGKRLAEMGHDVTVYCRTYFTPDLGTYHGMRLVRLPTIHSKHLETLVHTILSTIHVVFSDCEIVHYHALGPALFSFIPRMFGKKTAVTVQGLDWQRRKWGRVASFVLQIGESASACLPNRTMVVSRTLQHYYQEKYGRETIYVPNGTMLRQVKTSQQLAAWGLQPNNYVLFLGRFSPEKNCHLLIRAFEALGTTAKLVLAGGSSHSDSYAEELRKHESDRIIFLDWVSGDALDELLTNAAIFILPSDLEGLSLALLDAMGAGVCALTSDIPENRELVDEVGFTFRPGDREDLSRMLNLLLTDEDIRRASGRKARARISESYLWLDIAAQIAGVYEEILGIPKTQPKQNLASVELDPVGGIKRDA